MFPDTFCPLAAVVADFHLRTPMEAACESFLKARGMRRGVADRIWDWMHAPATEHAARQLLSELALTTDLLVSLGDHFSYVVNERGLAETRARVAALEARALLRQYFRHEIVHVPSDHDLGTRHRLSGATARRQLQDLSAAFEETEAFRERQLGATRTWPEESAQLTAPSSRGDDSLERSLDSYAAIFGPLWGSRPLGPFQLVWASDVLLEAHTRPEISAPVRAQAESQRLFLREALADRRTILCVHDPRSFHALLPSQPRRWRGARIPVIAGHLHVPELRWTLPRRIRKVFDITICPSLTGNRLTAGGGLLIGENGGNLQILRYDVSRKSFRT